MLHGSADFFIFLFKAKAEPHGSASVCRKNYIFLTIWGLGRSPKRGAGGSPTFSPFPGERGLGIGIENKLFFEKTDFFYKQKRNLTAPLHTFYRLLICFSSSATRGLNHSRGIRRSDRCIRRNRRKRTCPFSCRLPACE